MRWGAVIMGSLLCVLVIACEMRTYGVPQVLTAEEYLGKIRVESDGFVAELVDGAEPNQFKMKVTWPEFPPDYELTLARGENDEIPKTISEFSGATSEYIDEDIRPNSTYQYRLLVGKGSKKTHKFSDSRSLAIKVFPDIEFKKNGPEIKSGRYHRIFFREATRLDIAEDLFLLADEFIIEPNFEIHYWPDGGGIKIPKRYDLVLITTVSHSENSIQVVNEFNGFGAPMPSVLLESRLGEPFAIDPTNKNTRLCVQTPKLRVWDPFWCANISIELRKKLP